MIYPKKEYVRLGWSSTATGQAQLRRNGESSAPNQVLERSKFETSSTTNAADTGSHTNNTSKLFTLNEQRLNIAKIKAKWKSLTIKYIKSSSTTRHEKPKRG